MQMHLINGITVESFDSDPSINADVIIRLANGKVIQISPDFNAVNVWASENDFKEFKVGDQMTLTFDMGGNAAGEYKDKPMLSLNDFTG